MRGRGHVSSEMISRSPETGPSGPPISDIEEGLFARRVGTGEDSPGFRPDIDERLIRSAGLVVEQPELSNAVRRGELGALAPVTVSPALVGRHLVGREVRVEDDRGRPPR